MGDFAHFCMGANRSGCSGWLKYEKMYMEAYFRF